LLFGDVVEVRLFLLVSCVIDEDVQLAEFCYCSGDCIPAERRLRHVAAQQQAALPFCFHGLFRFFSIALFRRKVNDSYVSALTRIEYCHGSPDPRVTSSDQGDFAAQFSSAGIKRSLILGFRIHSRIQAGLLLSLRWQWRFGFLLLILHCAPPCRGFGHNPL
jgi:hypothetical protein